MKNKIQHPFASVERLRNRKIEQFDCWLNSPILDIGAGAGHYTKALRTFGYIVDCIEPDKSVRDPSLEYTTNHAYYETGLLLNVLHHLDTDPQEFLTHYLQRCKLLVVGELNADSWLVRAYHRIFVRGEIGRHYSRMAFLRLMNKFEVIDNWEKDLVLFSKVHLFAIITSRR